MAKPLPPELEPACFYLRKSREDQEAEARGEGETLAKHRKALYKLANEYGIAITTVFEEIVSGESILNRPAMLSLLKEIENGKWRSVWCMDVDRLGRGGMQDQGLLLETLKSARTKIVTPRKIYDLSDEFDEEYTEFEAFMARKELKLITRRLQSGRRRSVEEGNYLGTRPPYGYLIHKDAGERTLILHPEQADTVKLIFSLYTHSDPKLRMGSGKIAAELNRLGCTTYTGKPWDASTVLFILKNEIYLGRVQWRKKEEKKSRLSGHKKIVRTRPRTEWIDVPGKHPPLVTPAQFTQAQEILQTRYHNPCRADGRLTNPLSGLIRCENCGSAMIFRPYRHQKYPHLICCTPHCPTKSSRFAYIESALLSGLDAWLSQYHAQFSNYPAPNSNFSSVTLDEHILRSLNKTIKEAALQKNCLHDFLEKGIYDTATYLDRTAKLTQRIAVAEKEILAAENRLQYEKAHANTLNLLPKLTKLLGIYPKTTDASLKNQMLKTVLRCALYRKDPTQHGPEFSLKLFPKLPH
ncbi:MAG: Recombinase [Firmicutes bacterium]|nr:Recombinase [Bacillota bacterium]